MKGLDTVENLSAGAARESVKFGGWLQLILVKKILVLYRFKKVSDLVAGCNFLQLFHCKTALIYSVVTIYLGLCPRITEFVSLNNQLLNFFQIVTPLDLTRNIHVNKKKYAWSEPPNLTTYKFLLYKG